MEPTIASPGAPLGAPALPAASGRPLPGSPVTRLQPRTVGQLLDAGFEVIKFRPRVIGWVAAGVGLPLLVASRILVATTSATGAQSGLSDVLVGDVTSNTGRDVVVAFVVSGLGWLAQMLIGVAVAGIVTRWLVGSDPDIGEGFATLRRRGLVAVGAWGLALLVKVALSVVTCGLGVLVIVPMLSLLAPVIGCETGGVDSFRRAIRLGRRRLDALIGLSILWLVVGGAISFVTWSVSQLLGELLSSRPAWASVSVQMIGVVISLFASTVQASVMALTYLDVRVRTEGLDLVLDLPNTFGADTAAKASSHG